MFSMSQDDPILIDVSSDSDSDSMDTKHNSQPSQHELLRRGLSERREIDVSGGAQPAEQHIVRGASGNGDGDDEKKKGHKDPYKGLKMRWWFFTWNNPDHPTAKDDLLGSGYSYVKFQYEEGKEGTKHYQGVLYIKNKSSCSAIQKKFGGMGYLAPCKSITEALKYVGKEDTRIGGPWEAGTLPSQGSRTDLLECKSIIDGGGTVADVFESQFSAAVRYHRGFYIYHDIKNKNVVRTWQTACYCYYGAAGCGKTEAAKIESAAWGGGTFWLTLEGGTGGKVWWDGYEGEENIVLDEFACQMKYADFKRLIDSTPYKVPIKGGYKQFLGKRVWILSNNMIDQWYYHAASGHHRGALDRRLHYKEYFETKFQGAPDYDSFVDVREWFVELQKSGEVKIC